MIGSGRHKIEKAEHFQASMDTCNTLKLDGIVIIGGDDSNTNGAVLAEYFEANKCTTKVCGAPKTVRFRVVYNNKEGRKKASN